MMSACHNFSLLPYSSCLRVALFGSSLDRAKILIMVVLGYMTFQRHSFYLTTIGIDIVRAKINKISLTKG